MKLDNIHQEVCDCCGAQIVAETRDSQHCSGEYNETRRFGCGMKLHYSPNFRRIAIERPCPNLQAEVERYTKRKAAKEQMVGHISKLDCDDKFKAHLRTQMQYVSTEWG
jgi:hypothetical protein